MRSAVLTFCLVTSFFSTPSAQAGSLNAQQLLSGLSKNTFPYTLATLSTDTSDNNQYWYWLDLARLQQANGDFNLSIQSFEHAYAILDEYENRATISLRNVGSFLGSALLSKGSETYYGKGYERTLMHTLNALNYLMIGDFEGASVEMRRMEQRQEFWLKESEEKIKEASEEKVKAQRQGNDTSYIPQGYSMAAMLEDSDVRSMANNYQDPFSYTLSSIILDISGQSAASGNAGEISLKRALALNPDVSKAFLNLPQNKLPSQKSNQATLSLAKMDITVIVLSGEAPSLKIEKVRFPIFHGADYTSIDLPAYNPPLNDLTLVSISTDRLRMQPPRLLKSNVMAYKTLKDELPGELAKSVVRATTKAIAAKQASDHFGILGGFVASLAMDAGSSFADSGHRNWEVLPNSGYIAKLQAYKGENLTITLNGQEERFSLPSDKKGAVVLVSYLTPDNIRIDYVTY
ncbi:COG3014 family protein [Sulfuricurvum sp.]|uniref:COG3014 family protein n=1 Tax=Sulfuricurvum sp. TaxID=2025608 RepID=UPI0035664596